MGFLSNFRAATSLSKRGVELSIKLCATAALASFVVVASGCSTGMFGKNATKMSGTDATVAGTTGSTTTDTLASNAPAGTVGTLGGTSVKVCSQDYTVPGTANPYLAGMPDTTNLDYTAFLATADGPNGIDVAPAESPILVTPSDATCLTPGKTIYFQVSGNIAHGSAAATDANGDLTLIDSHRLQAALGKSNITAPLNSMIGVFLDASTPQQSTKPTALDFTDPTIRDGASLSPMLGQVFFIGTGLTSAGALKRYTVPTGATRFYLAIMDDYQWNNNSGSLTGALLTDP